MTGNPATEAMQHRQGVLVAAFGVFALSFDALLVRLADTSPWNVTFWRGWLIVVSLVVLQLLRRDRPRRPDGWPEAVATIAVVLLYGVNTGLFVLSVSTTNVANTVVILSCSPFFAAVFSWFFLRERVRLRTWVAIAVSISGVLVVFAGSVGEGNSLGDALAVLLAVNMGISLTILRRFPAIPRIPVTCGAGAVAGLLAWPLADPLSLTAPSYASLAVMGLFQMPLAMVLIMSATRYLPSPEVSLFLLIETVLGPIWVWFAVGEEPPSLTLVGGVAILGAVAVHSWLALREAGRRGR